MKTKTYEFQIKDLLPIGFSVVVLGIGLAYGLQIMSETEDDTATTDCTDQGGYWNSATNVCQTSSTNTTELSGYTAGTEVTAIGNGLTGVSKIPAKLPTIMTIVVAAVIIGILVRYLLVRYR